MKVLLVHNRYQQRGGEDAVVDAEACMLAAARIEVERFDADNDAIHGSLAKIRTCDKAVFGIARTCVSESPAH